MIEFTYYNIKEILLDNILTYFYVLNYIYIYETIFILVFSIIIWSLLINKAFKAKFIYFLFLLLCIGSWGVFYSYDGIIMLLIIAELLIILLFLLMYLTLNFELQNSTFNKTSFYSFVSCIFVIYFFTYGFYDIYSDTIYYINTINIYEQTLEIISADFFIFFYFFFLIFPEVTYIVALLLGFFSIFFIFLFFILKYKQQSIKLKSIYYIFIRKQQLTHQIIYNTQINNFQR